MWKALLAALTLGLLVALTVLLSGCGNKTAPGPKQPGQAPAKPCLSDNPFECHKHYVNPANSKEFDRSIATATGIAKTNLMKMQTVPSAFWIDVKEKIRGNGTGTVEGILRDASSKAPVELVVLIWYDLPNRDCDAKASLGQICCTKKPDGTCDYDAISDCAAGIQEYKTGYVDPFVEVLAEYQDRLPIIIVLEPDGLGNLATNLAHPHCGNQGTQAAYKAGVKYAVDQLTSKAPKVTLYLDAAHGGWLGWANNMELFMKMLKGLDLPWDKIRGFATNTANYQPLGMQCPWCPDEGFRNGYCLMNHHRDDPCCRDPCGLAKQFNSGNNELNYASFLAAAAKDVLKFRAHIVIDTGRNGVTDMRQSCQNWCNPRNAGAGLRSTTETANKSLVDAYFWLKTPGESDGCSQTLPTGKPCPRYDAMCGSIDALGTKPDEKPAPEAGGWYDFQVKQLAANAQFDPSPHHTIPEYRAKYRDARCPFELKAGMKASDFEFTSSTGEHPCSGFFKQCGGKGWFGPTCCAGDCKCVAQGEYNSNCQPPPGLNSCGNSTETQTGAAGAQAVQAYARSSTPQKAARLAPHGWSAAAFALVAALAMLGAFGVRWLRSQGRLGGRTADHPPTQGAYEQLVHRK